MLPTGHLLAFFATACVLMLIPGPSVLFTVGRALTVGRRGALLTVIGNASGFYCQVALVAVGLGAVVQRSAAAYTVLRFAGAAYLIYLGAQAILHRRHASEGLWTVPTPKSTLTILREGFVVGLTNPKLVIFLTAVMPQFVDRDAGRVPLQILTLGLLLVAVGVTLDSVWALAAGTARDWFARSPRRVERMTAGGGVAIMGLGVSFLFVGHQD